jgi:hypothetical protein
VARGVGINEDWHDSITRWDDSVTVRVVVVLLRTRLRVIFLIEVQHGMFIIFATFYVATSLVTSIDAIIDAITKPFIGDAPLIRNAFEFVVVAEFAVAFILSSGAVADVIASNGQWILIKIHSWYLNRFDWSHRPPLRGNARRVGALKLIVEALFRNSRNVLAHRMIARVDVSVAIEKGSQDFGAGNNVTTAFKYSCQTWLNKKKLKIRKHWGLVDVCDLFRY